ncbi:hypothetical protein J3Q64DRAFT_1702862 [Phycomyces blakesleeanus]|uniref:SWIM-type domain-containing protein n=1 Tax=Phycomyces blakesleeanus TaxID=4837 RepID=A0ABR3ANF6_PHYBL
MDWKSIKNVLRMSEDRLLEVSEWQKEIKVQNSTYAFNIACNSVCAVLSNIMHATTSVAYDILYNEFLAATFHTNNLIESYHNQLKTFYLGRTRSLRVDRLIYLLAKVFTLDYRQENGKTLYGFQSVRLICQEEQKRRNTYMLDSNAAIEMVKKLNDTAFTCRSFTVDLFIYNIELQNDFLKNCTCPDTSKLCKHIFLINRMLDIPYSLRQSLFSSSSAVHVSNTDTKAVVDTSLLSDKIEADIMKYCQLYSVGLDSKIADYKRISEDMSQFLDTLKFAYNKLKEHGSLSQSHPPRQT